jgi:integrase
VDGKRTTKAASFSTKAEAQAWAARVETEIADGKRGAIPDKTFGDLLEKYRDDMSPTKQGAKWEQARIGLTLRDPIAQVRLADLKATHIAAWRDRRLRSVQPGSVRREWTLLSSACTVAWKEWHWLDHHPMTEVKRPAPPKSRDRLPTQDEIDRLLLACGEDYSTMTGRLGLAILFAIETALREGEIAALEWQDIHLDDRWLRVRKGKTDAASRDVPLSSEAVRLLDLLPRDGQVFAISSASIDALFRKMKSRALIDDLHFHDLRHLAITRLSRKLDVLALARAVGHRDLRMLQIYYNESASALASRLD